ncbi:MAG: hypothetical protein LQ340_004396 [Diploschistes diacapsis]|nr:MAG: hypothetical protein LQ340_004396 [Diploschistes diacapsis]
MTSSLTNGGEVGPLIRGTTGVFVIAEHHCHWCNQPPPEEDKILLYCCKQEICGSCLADYIHQHHDDAFPLRRCPICGQDPVEICHGRGNLRLWSVTSQIRDEKRVWVPHRGDVPFGADAVPDVVTDEAVQVTEESGA